MKKTTLVSVQRMVQRFVSEQQDNLKKIEFVVGISRGGLIPAALIATQLDKPLVSVYIDRHDRVYIDRGEWIKDKRVLLVDDIVRTGSTFEKMIALLKLQKPKSIKSFTLFCLKNASVVPTWTRLVTRDQTMPWDRCKKVGNHETAKKIRSFY